jgi:hypothetical protein
LINIRNQLIKNIIPKKLKFKKDSRIYLQNFNNERIILNINNCNIDIFSLFDLERPMISYDISNLKKINKNNFEILSVFFYEKLMLLLTKEIYGKENEGDSNKERNNDRKKIFKLKIVNLENLKYSSDKINNYNYNNIESYKDKEIEIIKDKEKEYTNENNNKILKFDIKGKKVK